jgi:hypothetical protein
MHICASKMASDSEKAIEVRCASCAHRWTLELEELREMAHGGVGPNAVEVVAVPCPRCEQPRKLSVGPNPERKA